VDLSIITDNKCSQGDTRLALYSTKQLTELSLFSYHVYIW